MRYKKKGAGMPKGAGNGMYMNGGRMYSTGGAVPGGTGPRTFQKINVPEVELSGAAGNREASMVHKFTETSIPGVYTSDRTQAGQKVFYDEDGKQFTPEALRAHAEKSSKGSGRNPMAAFPMGYTEASSSFNSMLPEVMMTDYEKELATRGQQRAAARRAGTFDPNAMYNKIPIPAGYSTFDSWMGDTSPDAFKELEPRIGYIERGMRNQQDNVEVAAHDALGKNKEGQSAWVASLNAPNQPVYYAGSKTKKEVSPTQMVLNALRYGGLHGQNIMRAMESSQPSRANNIKTKIQANKETRAKVLPKIGAKRAKQEEYRLIQSLSQERKNKK
jgi:hypothetical protein